jgi:hypothetical protein
MNTRRNPLNSDNPMKQPLLHLVVLVLMSSFSTTSFADTIVNTFPALSHPGFGADSFGTSASGDVRAVGEKFTTYREYSQITGEVLLFNPGGPGYDLFPMVSFSIVADDAGIPGGILATTSFNLVNPNLDPIKYDLAFSGLGLQDATNYWLVASSSAIGNTPSWVISTHFFESSQTAINRNGTWDEFIFNSAGFALFGTVNGDPIDNGLGPTPAFSTPEPSTLVFLGSSLALLAAWQWKRRGIPLA